MGDEIKSVWNSLEVAKLCVGLLTPLAVVIIGYFVQKQLAAQNQSWQGESRIVERRFQVYDSVRTELNRIYCFVKDVGTWKEDNPDTVLRYKRDVDGIMHSQRAVWLNDTFQAYLQYVQSAFREFGGMGTDAKIRSTDDEKKVGIQGWKPEWSARLTGERDPNHDSNYDKLQALISRDLALRK
jgi:hypothetical protein